MRFFSSTTMRQGCKVAVPLATFTFISINGNGASPKRPSFTLKSTSAFMFITSAALKAALPEVAIFAATGFSCGGSPTVCIKAVGSSIWICHCAFTGIASSIVIVAFRSTRLPAPSISAGTLTLASLPSRLTVTPSFGSR